MARVVPVVKTRLFLIPRAPITEECQMVCGFTLDAGGNVLPCLLVPNSSQNLVAFLRDEAYPSCILRVSEKSVEIGSFFPLSNVGSGPQAPMVRFHRDAHICLASETDPRSLNFRFEVQEFMKQRPEYRKNFVTQVNDVGLISLLALKQKMQKNKHQKKENSGAQTVFQTLLDKLIEVQVQKMAESVF